MEKIMRSQARSRITALLLASTLPLSVYAAAPAGSEAVVQSTWQPQEIQYSYIAFTTAYNCDAFESKLRNILTALGAHPQTKVRASGCELNRPSRNFFVTITTATPVSAADAALQKTKATPGSEAQQKLLDRLGVKKPISSEPFPAAWKTVDLSGDRRLDLQPGDCELMEGLRDHVLPKLGVKIVADRVQCTPKQLSIQTPELKVSALVALPSADKPKPTA
jgi:hypothetical protein